MTWRSSLPIAGLVVALAIVATVGTLAHQHLASLDEEARWVSHTHQVVETARAVVISLKDAGGARRMFAITGDETTLGPYRVALARVASSRATLRTLMLDDPAVQTRIDRVDALVDERLAQLEQAIREQREQGTNAAREDRLTAAGNAQGARLSVLINDIEADEQQQLAEREAAFLSESRFVRTMMVFGFGASAVVLVIAFASLRREVARRARSERAVADRERRFRRLVEAAPDAIVISDRAGRISIVNEQVTTLFGYTAAELVGQPVEVLIPARGSARRKDGSECAIETSLSPLQTPEGTNTIAVVRDVTQRRELERFRDEYVGYISHDLRNPLSTIALQAQLLARLLERSSGGEATDELEAVRVIADNATYIDKLVRELLEMAYVESDEIVLHRDAVALAPFLESIVARTLPAADRSRVQLDLAASATVSIDGARVERVIANFLHNAIKYSPAGSPIVLRLVGHDDRAEVAVIDRGPGVAPDERAMVFQKYKRTASARRKEGFGLGLYISRKIVEAHGGEIGVDAAPGGGAKFFFRLPRIADAAVPARRTVRAASPSQRLRGLNVLLVDDEPNAVSALSALLDDDGLHVAAATSGVQALELADGARPDVAVVDVQMPGMSGLELLDQLRARYPGLPAVIMTGMLASDRAIKAHADEDTAYLGKPVDVDELLRTLERLCHPSAS
ncbi:MAG TPA: CHASE3 domain-containing protein [Kofleriaceae bacterium]|nr:CHASE3 domain-containing protein [Kofleriaceae bacterium]